MRRVVPLLIVLCLGFAPAPVYRERPDITGVWDGHDWGSVVIGKTKAGDCEGTYSATHGKATGRIHLTWSPRERRFVGRWHEGEYRFGDISLRLLPSGDAVKGVFTADPKCKIDGGSPRRAILEWNRAATSAELPGMMRPIE